jgi:effector-binding domain-containing protein
MLTLPVKNRRKKQPYLAIRSRLFKRQIHKQAQLFLPEVRKFMEEQGIPYTGPSFFRYNTISPTGEMDIEFGHFTDKLYSGSGPVRAGILPAGSFMSVTWTGHYNRLSDVNAMLMGWAKMTGVEWDCASTEAGTFFGCRIDIFHRSMRNEPNPDKWETEVAIMLKVGAGES